MSEEFILPIFKKLSPIKINMSVRQVKQSKMYNADYSIKEPSKEKFEEAFRKLKNDENLRTKDYRILSYYLNVLDKNNYLEKYIKSFIKDISRFIGYRGFVRPLLSYVYNFYDNDENSRIIFALELKVIDKLSNKEKFQYINKTFADYSNKDIFLNRIENLFSGCNTENDINELLKKIFLKETDKFYSKCMINFILKKFKDDELFDICKSAVKMMELSMQQIVFKGIMDNYIDVMNVDLYPDRWFKEIGETLKEPYSRANTRWNNMEDKYKETYRRWNNSNYLYEFFNNVSGDRVRLEFWKKYINSIYRIEYFSKINDALVMEFKNHVFVEFAQMGNALYIYDKRIYDLDKIKHNTQHHTKTECVNILKNPGLMEKKLMHRGDWQLTFKRELNRRGYEQDRW